MSKDTMYIYASHKKIDGDKKNQIDEDLTYSSEEDAIKYFVNGLSGTDVELKEKFDNGEDIKIYLHQLDKNNEPYYYKTVEVEKDNDSESGYDIDDEEEVELPDDFVPYGGTDDSKEDTSDEKEGSKETEQETSSEEKPADNEKHEPADTDGKKDKKTDKEENKDQQSDTPDDVQDLKESVMALSDEFLYHPEFTESIAKRASYIMQEFGLNDKETMNESLSYMAEGVDRLLNKLEESAGFNIETRLALCAINQYFTEKTLKAKDRNALDADEFGIPSLRKYPIPDKAHVTAAVQRFNYVDKAHEKELAANLIKALKKYDMLNEIQVSDNNRFKKYLDSAYKEFNESYDVHPFPTELTIEFSVGAMLPMMGSTEGWGTKLANTPIEDVVAANNVDMEKYATLYDTSELENDAINYRKKLYTGTSLDDGLITRESVLYEGVIPHRNIIFDKEVETFVKAIKDYISNPKNDFLEDILKKSLNFKKNIYTIRLKEQDGKDSNKIINKIKSFGFREVDDQGVKAIFEKEVKGLLLTMVYDTVGDKIRITYELYDKDKELKESTDDIITEGVLKNVDYNIRANLAQRIKNRMQSSMVHDLNDTVNNFVDGKPFDVYKNESTFKVLKDSIDYIKNVLNREDMVKAPICVTFDINSFNYKAKTIKETKAVILNAPRKTYSLEELYINHCKLNDAVWHELNERTLELENELIKVKGIPGREYEEKRIIDEIDAVIYKLVFVSGLFKSDISLAKGIVKIAKKYKSRPIEEFIAAAMTNSSTVKYKRLFEATKDDIDEDIRALVDKLNRKGYKTKYSCSGHTKARIKEDGLRNGIYNGKLYTTARIVFADDYKLSPPKGWKVKTFDGKIGIYPIAPNYEYKDGVPDDAFEKWKNDYMAELKLWVNDLPDKPGPTEESPVDNILDEFYDTLFEDAYLTEKKTREEYTVDRFKKKHDYDKDTDTIKVDGKRYKVDMDYKNPSMKAKDENNRTVTQARQTSAEIDKDDPNIHLDKNFFKLKNDSRREAVLQHEVGHTKLHSLKGDNKKIDKSMKTNEFIDEFLSDSISYYVDQAKKMGIPEKEAKEQAQRDFKSYAEKLYRDYQKGGLSKDEARKKLRESAISKLSKYKKSSNMHVNTREFEADRYAANKTSSSTLKKGLREYNKLNSKDIDDPKYAKRRFKVALDSIDDLDCDEDVKKQARENTMKNKDTIINTINNTKSTIKKEQNRQSNEDYNQRQKALKDKSLTQKEKDNYR